MPVPLPPQHSKRETRESQSSVVPSDHEPSEKKDEKYQAKISPSSPQGPLKKRSAFEDLTNMIPLGNTDIDCSDPLFSSVYAKDIFSYMKKREVCRGWGEGK
uniref:Uncharacterized protein n=1 Tax=Capra hircus TaxID=9925 RepID=A0A8C2R7X6_CAPHI